MLPLHHSRVLSRGADEWFLRIPGWKGSNTKTFTNNTMSELHDIIEERKCHRDAVVGIGAIILTTYLCGGIWWGVKGYRQHNGDVAAAEQNIRDSFKNDMTGTIVSDVTWPARHIGYWLAK